MRARMLAPLQLRAGEAVLDVGCGTGTLALHARRLVGPAGLVAGIDAAHEMVARARRKAASAGLSVHFELASADSLPFPDASFDVVMCTVTLHHLPRWMRAATLREMRRVLKPGGRVLLVDFVFGKRRTVAGLLHHHVGMKARDFEELVSGAGMHVKSAGSLDVWDMYYVVARG
jgi:ubiquinone/menaquinone biosynthesis C-methylase UbiE